MGGMGAERPRLVAIDLDGTLLRGDKTVSARTLAALGRVRQAGAHYVVVTGRPPRYTAPALQDIAYQGLALCSNGALTYDTVRAAVTEQRLIPAALLPVIAGRLRAAIPGLGIAVEHADHQLRDHLYQPGAWGGVEDDVPRLDDGELFQDDAVKLLARHPGLSADDLLALGGPAAGDLATVYHSGGIRLLEVTAAGVDKGTALAHVAAKLGVAAPSTVAFGDMVNDLPMLAWAGTSFGMANGHPDVLAKVDEVVPANDEDGVAVTLERLFPAPAS
jgi:hydroxymethylpyrimidine pyrophosphatase-like HAD family hydrolase